MAAVMTFGAFSSATLYLPALWMFQAAKNHGVILPDANKEATLTALVGAAFGAAGQRCMALSTVLWVGESRQWIPEVAERAKQLKVNAGE